MFKNRVLRKIFLPEREGLAERQRKLCEKPQNFYSAPDIIRAMNEGRLERLNVLIDTRDRKTSAGAQFCVQFLVAISISRELT